VRIFFEKVVFDRPHLVEAQFVGQADLLEAILIDLVLRGRAPRARDGDFVEQTELHGGGSLLVVGRQSRVLSE
jgi:hypothetical protein